MNMVWILDKKLLYSIKLIHERNTQSSVEKTDAREKDSLKILYLQTDGQCVDWQIN